MAARCLPGSDNQFGPRVHIDCRAFDFTLLFEDSICVLVPAAILLLLLPSCWQQLKRQQIKVCSYNVAVQKLLLLTVLFVLHVLYTAFQSQSATLKTKASLAAAVTNVIAVPASAWTSLMEDQHSIAPSSVLVLYFSAATLLALPRLRSLWLISESDVVVCRGLWTAIFAVTLIVLLAQSTSRLKSLQPAYRSLAKEQRSGFWGRGFFIYLLPLLKVGNSKILDVSDLPQVDEQLQGSRAGKELQKAVTSCRGRHRVPRAAFKAYTALFLWAILPRLALTAFNFAQPLLLTATINFMESDPAPENTSYGPSLVGAYVLVYIGMAVSTAVYWRQTVRFLAALRAGLVSMTYEQTLALQPEDLNDSAALTLMGTDVERAISNLQSIHELWASVIEVGIALWLLARQLGVACLVPLVIALCCVGLMVPISTRSGEAQKQWIDRIQKRLAITSSMLGDIKAVKMLGVSNILSEIVTTLREVEVEASLRFRRLLVWLTLVSSSPTQLAPFATLAIYAGISASNDNGSLLSAQAFTSLALISLLTSPLLGFCQTMPGILQALSCLKRIEEYCDKKQALTTDGSSNIELQEYDNPRQVFKPLVSFRSATIFRAGAVDPVLNHIDLDIHPGITAIIGPVGSGKTTLLETIIGRHTCEPTLLPLSRVAYAPQSPWIMNQSIRQNIIGVSEFDHEWYDFVITSCGLEEDLKYIHEGDARLAGSRGASLSGGQRQRVALARAVYSKLDVLVLDSPFSGLDTRTLTKIKGALFSEDGHFRRSGRSVILVTNNYEILSHADEVIVLSNGGISARGSYQEISSSMPHVFDGFVERHEDDPEAQVEPKKSEPPVYPNPIDSNDDQSLVEMDCHTRQKGSWSVYGYYMKPAGWVLFAMVEAMLLFTCFQSSFSTIWIQWWVEANAKQPNQHLAYYLGIYGLLYGTALLMLAMALWLYFTTIMSRISLKLHAELLTAAVAAPMSFFQTTDIGAITNRFSQDLELIDMLLPLRLVNLSDSTGRVLVQLIIVCIIGKYVAISIPFLAVTLYFIQSYYLRTSRQVRLLDIEAKAPLYTHFLETLDGIASIHAFGWSSAFRNQSLSKLNSSQRPFYMLLSIQKWLELVVSLVVGGIAVALVATMTSLKSQFNGASVGVALNLVLTFNLNLKRSVENWTLVEVSVGAVQRIQSFSKDTPREDEDEDEDEEASEKRMTNWIMTGEVQFERVNARYDTSLKPILANISATIKHGEKVAVCGPSGSGKTSFIMAILRMLKTDGKISISNTDISTIQRSLLRRTINVIPQDPLLFPGSVRFNIDPHGLASTHEIEEALRKVHMWNHIQRTGGINAQLEVSQWSVGQKQLLELARALLVKSPILILDEATSSMDWETESIMQSVVDTVFAEQTVIAVIHRFRYIGRFDRVMLLKQGRLVENDAPGVLMSYDSEFSRLYRASKME